MIGPGVVPKCSSLIEIVQRTYTVPLRSMLIAAVDVEKVAGAHRKVARFVEEPHGRLVGKGDTARLVLVPHVVRPGVHVPWSKSILRSIGARFFSVIGNSRKRCLYRTDGWCVREQQGIC